MKNLLTFCGLVLSLSLNGQNLHVLSNNNLKATVDYSGKLFNDVNGLPGLTTANDKSLIYHSIPWFLGTKNNFVKGFSPEDVSVKYGPIMNPMYYGSNSGNWTRVWHVTRAEIINHYYNYMQAGYVIPDAILEWPAHGNTQLGQAANLASFYDLDGNGIYNPANGDFPIIRGDECVFYIVNDGYTPTGFTEAAGLELHVMVYTYTCSSYDVLNNTVFVNYRVFNRSTTALENFYFGMYSDFDMGFSEDDFYGADVKHSAVYAYNGDSYDENAYGLNGFGNYPGMIAMTILGGSYQAPDGIDNPISLNYSIVNSQNGISYSALGKGFGDGIVDNERLGARFSGRTWRPDQVPNPDYAYPETMNDKYSFLRGIWNDGSSFYYGGGYGHYSSQGAIDNGLIPCRFLVPGVSDPAYYNTYGVIPPFPNWGYNFGDFTPSDVSGFISTGPGTIYPNQYHDFDIAFVYANNSSYGNINGAWGNLQTRLQGVHQYFEMNATPCGNQMVGIEELKNEIHFEVFPNPATNEINFKSNSFAIGMNLTIYDLQGKELVSYKLNNPEFTISLHGIPAGSYLLKVYDESRSSFQKLIITK